MIKQKPAGGNFHRLYIYFPTCGCLQEPAFPLVVWLRIKSKYFVVWLYLLIFTFTQTDLCRRWFQTRAWGVASSLFKIPACTHTHKHTPPLRFLSGGPTAVKRGLRCPEIQTVPASEWRVLSILPQWNPHRNTVLSSCSHSHTQGGGASLESGRHGLKPS